MYRPVLAGVRESQNHEVTNLECHNSSAKMSARFPGDVVDFGRSKRRRLAKSLDIEGWQMNIFTAA